MYLFFLLKDEEGISDPGCKQQNGQLAGQDEPSGNGEVGVCTGSGRICPLSCVICPFTKQRGPILYLDPH